MYQYDQLDQVISGRRYWADGTPVAGQQFEYGFDDIGNRTTTGSRASAESTYTVNDLNQYTKCTVAGKIDVFGIANPTADVTVESVAADRHGEYFYRVVMLDNHTAPPRWTPAFATHPGRSGCPDHRDQRPFPA